MEQDKNARAHLYTTSQEKVNMDWWGGAGGAGSYLQSIPKILMNLGEGRLFSRFYFDKHLKILYSKIHCHFILIRSYSMIQCLKLETLLRYLKFKKLSSFGKTQTPL